MTATHGARLIAKSLICLKLQSARASTVNLSVLSIPGTTMVNGLAEWHDEHVRFIRLLDILGKQLAALPRGCQISRRAAAR